MFTEDDEKPLTHLMVLDFEANAIEDEKLDLQEIIEFPVVIVDIKERKIVDIFHRYIKPTVMATLTEFCTKLTGITQETVNKGITLEEALKELTEFIAKTVSIRNNIEHPFETFRAINMWRLGYRNLSKKRS